MNIIVFITHDTSPTGRAEHAMMVNKVSSSSNAMEDGSHKTIELSAEAASTAEEQWREAPTLSYASKEYEQVVEDLLHPERFPAVDEDLMARYR